MMIEKLEYLIKMISKFLAKVFIGSGNGLAANRGQTLIWANEYLVNWRIYTSHGLNELKPQALVASSTHSNQRVNRCGSYVYTWRKPTLFLSYFTEPLFVIPKWLTIIDCTP